ncbi:MAG: hypothetical protein PVF05_02615 [Gemmatimonadales bacterium]
MIKRMAWGLAVLMSGEAFAGGLAAQSCAPGPSQAEVFRPELTKTRRLYRGAWAPEGRTFWHFEKTGPAGSQVYRIFRSERAGNRWTEPAAVSLGDSPSDLYPALSPDGRTLVFASYRRGPGDDTARPSASLWLAHRTADGWSDPQPVPHTAAPGFYHSGPWFDGNGSLHFHRTSPDRATVTPLVMRREAGHWTLPAEDTLTTRWRGWRDDAYVWDALASPDGRAVVLGVSPIDPETGGRGPTDIWVSRREAAGWGEPRRAGLGVNQPDVYDNFFHFSPDGCTLYWTRDFSSFHQIGWEELLASIE